MWYDHIIDMLWVYHKDLCGSAWEPSISAWEPSIQGVYVPRLVDHAGRRRQITDAVRRVIVSGGLEAVTFQTVAAEAGTSIRLVQYYFGTKAEFLLATHRSVMEDAGDRFAKRWNVLDHDAAPRELVRAILIELLPLDARRREEAIVLSAFDLAAITGQGISADDASAALRALTTIISQKLRQHKLGPGDKAGAPELDAELISTAIGGLSHGLLTGHIAETSVIALTDRLLDRFFGPVVNVDPNPIKVEKVTRLRAAKLWHSNPPIPLG